MTEPERPLMPLLMRFSADSAIIRQLVLSDEAFNCMVEDYLLAHNTLKSLRKQVPPKAETIAEYAILIQDLEEEINNYLARLRGKTF